MNSRFQNLEVDECSGVNPLASVQAPDEASCMVEAGKAFRSGDFERALRWYSKVLEYNADNTGAWTGQVRMLIEMSEFREAKVWADKALEKFPNEPELLAAKAVALARLGDHETAVAFSDAAMSERGDTPYVWLARGDVFLACDEHRAEFCFQRAIGIPVPDHWFVRWLASRIHSYYKKFAIALKLAQEALELAPTESVLWLQVGNCQLALGLHGPAGNSFTQARQLNPGDAAAARGLAEISQTGFLPRIAGGEMSRGVLLVACLWTAIALLYCVPRENWPLLGFSLVVGTPVAMLAWHGINRKWH